MLTDFFTSNCFSSRRKASRFSRRCFPIGRRSTPASNTDGESPSEAQVEFCSNHIRSSKYSLLTFWILNPLEQFRRLANFTYLVMGIVQLCLPEPPVPPITTILPLLFVVVVSMIKQVKTIFVVAKAELEQLLTWSLSHTIQYHPCRHDDVIKS